MIQDSTTLKKNMEKDRGHGWIGQFRGGYAGTGGKYSHYGPHDLVDQRAPLHVPRTTYTLTE